MLTTSEPADEEHGGNSHAQVCDLQRHFTWVNVGTLFSIKRP
jgi:hypothetical protein